MDRGNMILGLREIKRCIDSYVAICYNYSIIKHAWRVCHEKRRSWSH